MKNKLQKLIPYFLILLVLAGIFGFGIKVDAQEAGVCSYLVEEEERVVRRVTPMPRPLGDECSSLGLSEYGGGEWTPRTAGTPPGTVTEVEKTSPLDKAVGC